MSRDNRTPTRILCVCLGNICRSPMAQAIFAKAGAQQGFYVEIDSAGTSACHVGEAPDRRMQAAARKRGYDLSAQRARQLVTEDFISFDYILTMDEQNYANAVRVQPLAVHGLATLRPVLSYLAAGSRYQGQAAVPDPYYGGDEGFCEVIDLLEAAADGFYFQLEKGTQ